MKKILIPTDFSENAWSSLIYAVKMFEKTACTFYLLHTTIMRSTSITNLSTDKLNAEKEKTIIELEKLKQEAEKINLNPNHTFKTLISYYHLDKAINYTTERQQIDFTIIGTKGATNTTEYFLGSNTTRVIKNIAECPTIIVPNEYYYKDLNKIVILSDLVHEMDKNVLLPIKQIPGYENLKINLLHLSKNQELTDSQTEELNSIKSNFSDQNFSYHSFTVDSNKEKVVNEFIEEVGANMLVLTYYKNTFLEKLILNKSLTTTISQNPIIPILILPNKK